MKTFQEESERNICSALRTAQSSNRCLMAQADKKAQMLIQVNGLLTTVLLALAVCIAPQHRWYLLPVSIQLLSSLIVIASSLLVIKPRFAQSHAVAYLNDNQKRGNRQPIANRSLYWNLLRDTHLQATVLAVKFRWLRISYHVFLAGLCLSISATLVVHLATRNLIPRDPHSCRHRHRSFLPAGDASTPYPQLVIKSNSIWTPQHQIPSPRLTGP